MLCETFIRAIQSVKTSVVENPNFSDDNPQVVVIAVKDDGEPEMFEVIGEVGAVMTLDDGRIGIVPSKK